MATPRDNGEQRVFPEVKPVRGNYGHYPSRWFNGYLKRTGVYVKQKKVYHSFRNTVMDRLLNAGHELPKVQALVGHEIDAIALKHYATYGPAVLRKMFEGMDYGVDFSRVPPFRSLIPRFTVQQLEHRVK